MVWVLLGVMGGGKERVREGYVNWGESVKMLDDGERWGEDRSGLG